jgi:dynein heavy chain, axonemal
MKDLEVMMQNLIASAFETVTTVEQGVEILDVFMHLSSREVCCRHVAMSMALCDQIFDELFEEEECVC